METPFPTSFLANDDDNLYYIDQNTTAGLDVKDGEVVDNDDFDFSTLVLRMVIIWLIAIGMCIFQLKQLEIENDRERLRLHEREMSQAAKVKKRFDPETRGKIVTSNIHTRKIKRIDSEGRIDFFEPEQNVPSEHDSNRNGRNLFIEVPDKNEDKNLGLACSICLESFELGQHLSWSRRLKCQHFFHSDCLVTWLMKHDDCPFCRKVLVEDVLLNDIVSKGKNSSDSSHDGESIIEEGGSFDLSSGVFVIVNGLVSPVRKTHHPTLCGTENEQDAYVLSYDIENTPVSAEDTHVIIPNKLEGGKAHRKTGSVRYDIIASDENILQSPAEDMTVSNTTLIPEISVTSFEDV